MSGRERLYSTSSERFDLCRSEGVKKRDKDLAMRHEIQNVPVIFRPSRRIGNYLAFLTSLLKLQGRNQGTRWSGKWREVLASVPGVPRLGCFPRQAWLAWLITDRADRNEQRRLTECVFVLRWYKVKNRPSFSAFCEHMGLPRHSCISFSTPRTISSSWANSLAF